MSPGSSSLLYWIALNRLPLSLAAMRRIHRKTGTEAALAALPPGTFSREESGAGTPEDGPVKIGPALWEQVRAGAVGCGSPIPDLDALSGEQLLEGAVREIERARALGIELIVLTDPRYPALLATIACPPPVLYAAGRVDRLFPATAGVAVERETWWTEDSPGFAGFASGGGSAPQPLCLAVVGSRSASEYGLAMSRSFAGALAARGATIVSGLALGIDAEAHLGALEAGGFTVAVLGGGLADVGDPAGGLAAAGCPGTNRRLLRRILSEGLVISEYPIGTPPLAHQFPRRNRILAGLCPAVILVEAAARSGALTTARLALEEGREVFAVPGRITTATASGCHGLIRSGAAHILLAPDQVLAELSPWWLGGLEAPGTLVPGAGGSEEALPGRVESWVLERLRQDDSTGVDDLLEGSPAGYPETLAALLALEMRGAIRAVAGGRYRLTHIDTPGALHYE
jgi:DNA processing protein